MKRRPAPSRWSLSNVRRLVRGALNACARADAKYGHDVNTALRVAVVRGILRQAETQLGFAIRGARVRAADTKRRKAA